jgi:hypothetical protein
MRQLNHLILWVRPQRDRLQDLRRSLGQDLLGLRNSFPRHGTKPWKLALRLSIAFVVFRVIVRLLAGRVNLGEFLDEIAVNVIASLFLKWVSEQ